MPRTESSSASEKMLPDAEELNALPSIELKARFLVSGFLAGIHKSPFSGGGTEFKEYKEYLPGDELRAIDWKIFARTDSLYIKKREDERNLTCSVILDASASMDYPRNTKFCDKWTFARTLAAAVNLFLIRQKDAVSVCAVSGAGTGEFSMPSTRASEFHRNIERMNSVSAHGSFSFPEQLGGLYSRMPGSSIVILVSDFYCKPESLIPFLDRLRSENTECILIRVLSPAERDLDFERAELLRDSESGEKLPVHAEVIREEYKKRLAAHDARMSDIVQGRAGDYVRAFTDRLPVEVFSAYLAARAHRRFG